MTRNTKPPADSAHVARFARAMARREFGRFFVSDADLAEVRRSLARKGRRAAAPSQPAEPSGPRANPKPRT